MAEKSYRGDRYYDTYGNIAISTAPDKKRLEREKRHYRESLLRQLHEEERTERRSRREYSAAQIAVFSAAILTAAVLLSLFMVQLSGNYRLRTGIEEKKAVCQALVRNNALLADEIDRQTDYAVVYRYAVEVLGMQAPESQQVLHYTRSTVEHVECGGIIPDE